MAVVLVSVFLHISTQSVHFKTCESKKLLNQRRFLRKSFQACKQGAGNFHWFYVNPGLREQAFEQPAPGVGCTKGE